MDTTDIAPEPTPATAYTGPTPSVGRIVHYMHEVDATDETPACIEPRAAIVTKAYAQAPSIVNISVFAPNGGSYAVTSCVYGTSKGQWTWPPKV